MVFGNNRGEKVSWVGLVVLWAPSDCLAFYDGYLGGIDGFCSADVIGGNWTVFDLVIFDGLF